MNATEFGIVMNDNNEHRTKHPFLMDMIEFGIAMDDNDEHS
jgi:hypothetical protein